MDCSGIQSIAIGGIVLLLGKTFVKLQKLVGYISASLNYHQSLESGKRSIVPEVKNSYLFNDYLK